MVLKKELRILHLAGNREWSPCHTEGNLSQKDFKAHPYSAAVFQEGQTYFHNAIPPNEHMGANYN